MQVDDDSPGARGARPTLCRPGPRSVGILKREGKEGFTRTPYTVNLKGKDQTIGGRSDGAPPSANNSRRSTL